MIKKLHSRVLLLEALWLYAQRGAPSLLWQILRGRHESKRLLSEGLPDPEARLQALKSLFYGRPNITLDLIPNQRFLSRLAPNRRWFTSSITIIAKSTSQRSSHYTIFISGLMVSRLSRGVAFGRTLF